MAQAEDASTPENETSKPLVERSRFGTVERRKPVDAEVEARRPPISSTELSKGPTELAEHRGPRVNWRVFVFSSAIVLAFSIWAMAAPAHAADIMHTAV